MADVKPNTTLEIRRLRMDIANQEAAIKKGEFDLEEIKDRIERITANIEAHYQAIEKMKYNLGKMIEAHGDPDHKDST